MSVYNEKTKRRVVPRWRDSLVAAASKDFQPTSLQQHPRRTIATASDLLQKQTEFALAPNLGKAAELLSCAIREHDEQSAKIAADYISTYASECPRLLRDAASAVLGGRWLSPLVAEASSDGAAISRIRGLLRIRPRSASLWVDLARHQAALGMPAKAERSIRVALGLAPDHRWILRSASRFFLHVGSVEEAHSLIARHPRTKSDPWLMAAELATAQVARKAPRFYSNAKDLLRHKPFLPIHTSELSAAVATLELESGSTKFARRLFRGALQDATENALAQIEWGERESRSGIELESTILQTPDAFEAACWVHYNDGDLQKSLLAAREWLHDEAYASRPVGMVCYLASFLDDHDTVIETARTALARHPNEPLHSNNFLYATLCRGDLIRSGDRGQLNDIAEILHRRVQEGAGVKEHAMANLGLLFYRSGQYGQGRSYYADAISSAEKSGNHLLAALAATNHARESFLSGSAWANDVLAQARKISKRVVSPGIAQYLEKLEKVFRDPTSIGDTFGQGAVLAFELARAPTTASYTAQG